MKKIAILSILSLPLITLTGCTNNNAPMTDAEMAKQQGMTMQEFKETKSAAARMNMTINEHVKMNDTEMNNMTSK